LVLLLVLGAGGWYARARTSSCVVGVNGAEASITVTGFGSAAACEELVRENPRASYMRQSPPDGGVLCEIQRGQKRYVVRDRGALMLVGRGICSALTEQTTKGNGST
jgi:hypothetical protein